MRILFCTTLCTIVLQYAVLLVLSFIAQVAVATLAFTFHNQVFSRYFVVGVVVVAGSVDLDR